MLWFKLGAVGAAGVRRARCRNGPACPWRQSGGCRFLHLDEEDGPLRCVLLQRTLEAGAVNEGYDRTFAPWARDVQPLSAAVDDPYLAGLLMHSPFFGAVARCNSIEVVPDLAPEDLHGLFPLAAR